MNHLRVTIVQSELYWEDIPANLEAFARKIKAIKTQTDLIVLPEMFTTGFTMNAEALHQDMAGSTVSWMIQQAGAVNAHITGSAIIEENGKFFNRLLWVTPQGTVETYDKKHLFRMTGEHDIYSAGNRHLTMTVNGWRIRPFICYDLRFPAWTRNAGNAYDVALFVANWPEKRSGHWKLLMPARAVENQCYVIGVNRVGKDGNGFDHSGDSSVIDPMGKVIFHQADKACIRTVHLDYEAVSGYREKFPVWRDSDRFEFISE